jgi:hypothetical protein
MSSLVRLRRRVLAWIRLELTRPRAALAALALGTAACSASMGPKAKLDEAVQDYNTAARFGRLDIARERVASIARVGFAKRHALWGSDVRVVDVEMGSVEKSSNSEVTLLVAYSWFRPNEGTLRTTTVRQTWKTEAFAEGWTLQTEERASGDVGLLGEPPVSVLAPKKSEAHFQTLVIPGDQ